MKTLQEVEARTQELGRLLFDQLSHHAPSASDRVQNRLMLLLMEDHALRTRLLRYVDVLAALPEDALGRRAASLYREYFRADFSHLSWPQRLALATSRSRLIPSPVLAWATRHAVHLMAGRFIVSPREGKIEESLHRLRRAARYPSFDLLGEAVLSEEEARQYKQGYLDLIERLSRLIGHGLPRTAGDGPALEISLKLSSMVPNALFTPADPEGTLRRVRPALEAVCEAAQSHGIGVTIDAEQYAYRDLAWHILQRVFAPGEPLAHWPDAGLVIQAYLRDAESHAGDVLAFSRRRGTPIRVRLVKGAYWDYEAIVAEQHSWPVPVHRAKGATDLAFQRIAETLLQEDRTVRLAVGSHNVRSHAYVEALREARGLPGSAVEHQTLHRTLEPLSWALPRMGWVARDYVAVGDPVPGMAYLVRRILENTSQAGFLTQARLHEDVDSLLRPPASEAEDTGYQKAPDPTGFVNSAPLRLFDPVERQDFETALQNIRSKWGVVQLLRLGDELHETGERLASLSPSYPAPSEPVGWTHVARPKDTERAIGLANEAASSWAALAPADRATIGLRAATVLRSRREEIAAWIVHEGGRTWGEAAADVDEACDHVEWNARQLLRMASRIEADFQPRGVVACISPWNFPAALPAGMISAALMAGNAVIFKSARQTPIVGQVLVEAFHDGGVPRQVLIHLPGPGESVGTRLVESPDVNMVAFTGSKDTGTQIFRRAATVIPTRGGIKNVVAEMGGKNAIVVFADADVDEAVLGILVSAFSHAGQKCSACSRVLVHKDVYDRLAPRLVNAAKSLAVGRADDPGTFMNPVISADARRRILQYRDVAYQEGRVLLDAMDTVRECPYSLGPLIVEIDAAKAATARIAQEEVFGPILTLVRFRSEAEAVALHNNTAYALTAGVFSRSPDTIRRVVRACLAGNIYVNRETVGARVGIEPFGGYAYLVNSETYHL